ncbi:MAG: methyltransferase domain-containing protein [Gemmatimonadales bacterium]|nr:MAG: methyltransferase domain-containing protein [Gemmatimonadales bacterium]
MFAFMRMNANNDFPDLVDRLGALGEETRLRVLLVLERGELNVSELARVLQVTPSSVSRHLRTLEGTGWVQARSEGPSRVFRLATPDGRTSRELWSAVRGPACRTPRAQADAERAVQVLAERRERSRDFFRTEGGRWDQLRSELFGARSTLLPLVGLLDREWVVGDLGCGSGAFSEVLAPAVRRVVAVDREPQMLAAARERLAGHANVDFHTGDLESLPLDDGHLDAAFLVLVLHLVADPRAVLAEAARVLAPGGRLVVSDMRSHDREQYRADMGHLWTGFDPALLAGWLEDAGFEGVSTTPLAPEPEARGPLLFTASARLPRRGSRKPGADRP